MSAPTPSSDRDPHPERVVGIFVTVTWAAVVFAAYGLLAAALDRDPIELPVGPLYGVAALALAAGVVYLGILFTVPRPRPWLGGVATAAGVYLVLVGSGAVLDLALAIAQAASPFALVAAALSAVAVVGTWFAFARRRHS